jgi:hypothetical protein
MLALTKLIELPHYFLEILAVGSEDHSKFSFLLLQVDQSSEEGR